MPTDRHPHPGTRPAPRPRSPGAAADAPGAPALLRRALGAPGTLPPAEWLQLQRAVGNRAVGTLMRKPTGYARTPREWTDARGRLVGEHRANQKKVYDLINGASAPVQQPRAVPGIPLDREQLLANTMEFLRRRCIVVVLTPTLSTRMYPYSRNLFFNPTIPDPALRGQLFFDEESAYPEEGTKDDAAAEGLDQSLPGVYVRTSGETAHADPHARPLTMRIFMDGDFPIESLKTILIHEVQHLLDKHESADEGFAEEAHADVDGREGDVGNTYRTEFRAYWVGDRPGLRDFGDPTRPAANRRAVQWGTVLRWRYVNTAFRNERQENIFWYMVDAGIYPWVLSNYYFSGAFKRMVDDLEVPSGGNLLNSLAIENLRFDLSDFAKELRKVEEATRAPHDFPSPYGEELDRQYEPAEQAIVDAYTNVRKAADALSKGDRAFLNGERAGPFWAFFRRATGQEFRLDRLNRTRDHAALLLESAIRG